MDKNGPFATINSILKFDQANYANGTLCNMKFHPTALQGAEGDKKLRAVMETYFRGGGMELQINVVSAKMLREAQEKPKDYEDLVVRQCKQTLDDLGLEGLMPVGNKEHHRTVLYKGV